MYSQQHADIACNFFEKLLKHTADEWHGQPFILAPWQEEALCQIFGQVDERGRRLIEMAYIETPKKTGKTEFAAGLGLLLFIVNTAPSCQGYMAASGLRQTMNVYRAACKMIEQEPVLSNQLRIMRGTNRILKRNDPDSFIAAIAADGDLTDGVNPAFVIADELHRWHTRKHIDNWDVLSLGGIARAQSLTIAITTAGIKNESPLAWRYHEKTQKIADGVFEDRRFYGRIYGAKPTDNWESEETWRRANPSLKEHGGFLELAKIRAVYESSLTNPDEQVAFKRYYLNLWDEKLHRAINMQQWHACAGPWSAQGWPALREDHEFLKRFVDRRCWVGIDLSLTTDMSSVALVFPDDSGGYDVLPFFWMPTDNLRQREINDGMPYQRWVSEGFIETSPGQVIEYGPIRERLKWAAEMFDVREFCFDRCNSREMSVQMVAEGYQCVEIAQIYTGLNEATKKLLRLVAGGQLRHGAHPVLAWNASCLCLKSDDNDLVRPVKPDRGRDSSRIDGLSATIDALARAMLQTPDVRPMIAVF